MVATQEAEVHLWVWVQSGLHRESLFQRANIKTIKRFKKRMYAAFPYDQSSIFNSRDLTQSSGLNGNVLIMSHSHDTIENLK